MLRDHFGVVEIPYLVFVRTIGARLIKNIVGEITKWNILRQRGIVSVFIGFCRSYVMCFGVQRHVCGGLEPLWSHS